MDEKLGTVESRFADIVWKHEPISSGELVKLCNAELGWKKSTTYTVLKKLCDRGLFRNDGGTVRAEMSREEYFSRQSQKIVDESFSGSLPAFIAAFMGGRKLNTRQVQELKKLIDNYEAEDEE